MNEQAFEALKTYEWGVDPKTLEPITTAVVTTRADAAARSQLESRFAAVLNSDAPRAAKDYVCRQLRSIGTAAAVPALAKLLADEELSHMGRYALERIPAAEAGAALREALPKVDGELEIGVISSLGVRGEPASVEPLGKLLGDAEDAVAVAAAHALGRIGTPAAGKVLTAAKARPATQAAIADALLACAESLLAAGDKPEAKAVYERLGKEKASDPVREAAELGVKACGG